MDPLKNCTHCVLEAEQAAPTTKGVASKPDWRRCVRDICGEPEKNPQYYTDYLNKLDQYNQKIDRDKKLQDEWGQIEKSIRDYAAKDLQSKRSEILLAFAFGNNRGVKLDKKFYSVNNVMGWLISWGKLLDDGKGINFIKADGKVGVDIAVNEEKAWETLRPVLSDGALRWRSEILKLCKHPGMLKVLESLMIPPDLLVETLAKEKGLSLDEYIKTTTQQSFIKLDQAIKELDQASPLLGGGMQEQKNDLAKGELGARLVGDELGRWYHAVIGTDMIHQLFTDESLAFLRENLLWDPQRYFQAHRKQLNSVKDFIMDEKRTQRAKERLVTRCMAQFKSYIATYPDETSKNNFLNSSRKKVIGNLNLNFLSQFSSFTRSVLNAGMDRLKYFFNDPPGVYLASLKDNINNSLKDKEEESRLEENIKKEKPGNILAAI